MASLDFDLVRHALRTARAHGFAEVELSVGEDRFSARLGALPQGAVLSSADEETEPEPFPIPCSLVGYYQPAAKPLSVGDAIAVGQVIAVVNALGIANEVESPVAGEVVEVLVEPNQAVEYGQILARVKPQ